MQHLIYVIFCSFITSCIFNLNIHVSTVFSNTVDSVPLLQTCLHSVNGGMLIFLCSVPELVYREVIGFVPQSLPQAVQES